MVTVSIDHGSLPDNRCMCSVSSGMLVNRRLLEHGVAWRLACTRMVSLLEQLRQTRQCFQNQRTVLVLRLVGCVQSLAVLLVLYGAAAQFSSSAAAGRQYHGS
jgi:hypothetical protein